MYYVFWSWRTTSCGNPNAVLAFGQEYIMGIGGACEPINNWSPVSGYTPEDMEFIRRAAGNMMSVIQLMW